MTLEESADGARLKLEAYEADDLLGAFVRATAFDETVGRDDLEVNVFEITAFGRVWVFKGSDLHCGDRHARVTARKELASVGRERHAPRERADGPTARL